MADCSQLSKNLMQIAMNIGSREDVRDLDDVLVRMQGFFPELRRESLIEAMSEAMQRSRKQADETTKKLQRLRKEVKDDKKLNDQIQQSLDYLETGALPELKVKGQSQDSDAIKTLKDTLAGLKKKLKDSEPAQKKRIQEAIDALEEQMKTGDIFPKTREKSTPQSEELEKLQYTLDKLRKEKRERIYVLKPKSVWHYIGAPMNVFSRLLMTTGEFSFVGRQGGPMIFTNPVKWAQAVRDSFTAFTDEQTAWRINRDILEHAKAPLAFRAGLAINPIAGDVALNQAEEFILSSWLGNLPVIRNFQRAGLTFLNALRMNVFDIMTENCSKDGATVEEATRLATAINQLSGRANLGKIESAAGFLNAMLFAPRYVISRFQIALGTSMWTGNMNTRKAIAKEYGKMIIGYAALYAFAAMCGADIEWDPRSTDFMKIKIGNTRLDPLVGLQQIIVFGARLITGEKKKLSGEIVPIRGEDVPYGQETGADVIWRFLRTKMSVAVGTAVDLAAGEDVVGEKVTAGGLAKKLLIPITYRDVYEVMTEEEIGVSQKAMLSILAFFGAGIQTYQDKENKKQSYQSGDIFKN